ncbi:DedA family protein [Bacillus haimaensis]|uniref:DedA family protein n=1 Tax=Bacillus haimaensis TaxID=3160967 RepID=UPI003AA8DEE9
MDFDIILQLIRDYGYIGLFFWLWLGMFGIPVPNEVLVSSIGIISYKGILQTTPALLTIYLGVISSLTTCYLLGRCLGSGLYSTMEKNEKVEASLARGEALINKYHAFALCISYFLPGARNVVPFLAGFMKLPFYQFALAAYSAAIVWVTIFFFMGNYVWHQAQFIVEYRMELFLASAISFVLYYVHRWYKELNDPTFSLQKYR